MENSLLYVVKPQNHNEKDLHEMLTNQKNIRFVSLMGIDLGGNATDEKIPVEIFLNDINGFLQTGIQTDGSSVELYEIATLNNAKVDIIPDMDVNWYVDYNYGHIDSETNLPVGTLKIPAFLIHNSKKVCSRGILERAVNNFETKLYDLFKQYPHTLAGIGVDSIEDVEKVNLTSATELEFWVNTPEDRADLEALHVSQSLKEQYWKKTHGVIRTCLEKSLMILQQLGIEPEMGHKEVGGITSSISIDGKTNHAMEQLEIDWKYSNAMQAADNELAVREIIEDVFTAHGLEVTFKAKPLDGVAGSGEHTHIGVSVSLTNGKVKNVFTPKDPKADFMSELGYGALMGVLYNYEVVSPFVTSSNDGFNRLVPGFEAPVCTVTSLGHSYEVPSRNRSILIGLIRDLNSPLATRFELRAPNPLSNTYLVLSALYQSALHGMINVAKSELDTKALEKELSKEVGEEGFYLETQRAYRDENDVFEHYDEATRNARYATPPATVYENVRNMDLNAHKLECLTDGGVFTEDVLNSFKIGSIDKWGTELKNRIIQSNIDVIRSCVKLHTPENMDAVDEVAWEEIANLKHYLMKDTLTQKSLFAQIRDALNEGNYAQASDLQLEMNVKMKEMQALYIQYKKNLY